MKNNQNPTTPEDVKVQAPEVQPPVAEEPITPEALAAQLADEKQKLLEENAKLQRTIERLQSSADKSDAYLNQLVAMKNDFESYKRRMKFNAEQSRQEGVQSVALKLIDIADTFDFAKQHLKDDADSLKAFDMVHQKFLEVLHGLGITEMDVKGKDFDHMTMNALSKMDYGPENKDKVVEVYKNGYMMDDKVLRYAEVIVGA